MLQTCDFLYVHQNWHSVVILSVIQCPKYGDKCKTKWNFSSSQVSDHWTWFKHNLKLITPHMLKDDWKVWFLLHWVVGLRNWCLINATDTLIRSIWLCILSTYIFHRFIMEIPPLRSARTDKTCFFQKKQSWSKVGISWRTFDIPVGKFCESENFCQMYSVGAASAPTALQKTPLVNTRWVPLKLLCSTALWSQLLINSV